MRQICTDNREDTSVLWMADQHTSGNINKDFDGSLLDPEVYTAIHNDCSKEELEDQNLWPR